MKLQDQLPEGVEVDGKFYRLDFDFRNVLRMIDVLDRDDLLPEAKAYKALKCLCKRPRNAERVLTEVKGLLFKAPRKSGGQKATDFVQDAGLIRAAFRQAYGIDLYRDRLHWMEFTELMANLPDGNRYEETVGIRARPMPAATKYNAKEREWLMKAKQSVALHLNEREQQRKYDTDVGNVFAGLMSMMAKEVKTTDGK